MSYNLQDVFNVSEQEVKEAFGPGSSARASRLMKEDPARYRTIKAAGVYIHHIVPESALLPSQRISRDELEQYRRFDYSRRTQNEIPLTDSLCDRLQLPRGSKASSFEELQRLMAQAK